MPTEKHMQGEWPLDIIDKGNVKEVVYFPHGSPESHLGDNILLLPTVEGLAARYGSKLRVATDRPNVFNKVQGIRLDTNFDIHREFAGDADGKLMIGFLPVVMEEGFPEPPLEVYGQQIREFTDRGGHLIPFDYQQLNMFTNLVEGGQRTIEDRHPFFPNPHLTMKGQQSRAYLREMGVKTPQHPRIPVSDEEAEAAEKLLQGAGMPERGQGERILFNNQKGAYKPDHLDPRKAAMWVAALANGGAHVLVERGYTDDDFQKTRQIILMGKDLSDNPKCIHGLDRRLPVTELFPLLSRFDIVDSPDTGLVHAAAAVDGPARFGGPLVLAAFTGFKDYFPFMSENRRVLGYYPNDESMAQGMRAVLNLLSGNGLSAFDDQAKALTDIRALRGQMLGLDSVEDFHAPVDKDVVMSSFNRLWENVGDKFREFLHSFDLDVVIKSSKLWWMPIQQHQLYRYGMLVADLLDAQKDGPNLPSIHPAPGTQ